MTGGLLKRCWGWKVEEVEGVEGVEVLLREVERS
jgi:hypothetical protein